MSKESIDAAVTEVDASMAEKVSEAQYSHAEIVSTIVAAQTIENEDMAKAVEAAQRPAVVWTMG